MFILNCKSFKRISNDHFHIKLLDSQLTDTVPISTISYWREINHRAILQVDKLHRVVGVGAVWPLNMTQEIVWFSPNNFACMFPGMFLYISLTGVRFLPLNCIPMHPRQHELWVLGFLNTGLKKQSGFSLIEFSKTYNHPQTSSIESSSLNTLFFSFFFSVHIF